MDVLSAASNAACDSDVGHAEEARLSFALIVRYPVAVIGGGGGGKGAAHACVLQVSVFESASLHVPPLDAWVVTVRVHVRVPIADSPRAGLVALASRVRGGSFGSACFWQPRTVLSLILMHNVHLHLSLAGREDLPQG